VTDLTQQLFDDFKPYIKESHWDMFVNRELKKNERLGPVVNILIEYYPDTDLIAQKTYQRVTELGTTHGAVLRAVRVGVDHL